MLHFINSRAVFDRSTGINSFLLLNGHGSPFDLEFLEYITAENMIWHVEIGLPYDASYWQVGDSSEQNGRFKKVETNRKAVLTRGWGPKTVCYNNILHKEIIATKQSCKVPSTGQLITNITPSDLNENEGLAGTLIEFICLKYTEVARQIGQTAEERKKKCQESAKEK
jgi:hypothetical protein